ncbi:unnamed protein product [Penicillium discolor]
MLNALVTNLAAEGEAANNPLIPAWYDIIWSGFWFLIILAVVWKVALPRLTKMLDERSAAIEGNIAKADEAQKQAEAALEEYTRQLAEARTEAGEIREAAREDGKKIIAEAKETAASEAARLTATAHAQIEAERQTALVSLRSEVGSLALDLAGGVVGETLSDDARAAAVVDRFLADLEASDLRQAQTLAAAKDVTLETARELFAAARAGILRTAVAERWSNASELIDGLEELAIRAATIAEPGADIEGELFGFSRVIAANPELELALGSRLGGEDAKAALVERLLADASASAPTALIVTSLVRQPRERRVRQLLSRAMRIVSSQRGRLVATVHTATELSDAQRTRLGQTLSQRYGGQVSLNVVIDPSVVGGLRVQIADDVIDGSISARLADLRQKLAG